MKYSNIAPVYFPEDEDYSEEDLKVEIADVFVEFPEVLSKLAEWVTGGCTNEELIKELSYMQMCAVNQAHDNLKKRSQEPDEMDWEEHA